MIEAADEADIAIVGACPPEAREYGTKLDWRWSARGPVRAKPLPRGRSESRARRTGGRGGYRCRRAPPNGRFVYGAPGVRRLRRTGRPGGRRGRGRAHHRARRGGVRAAGAPASTCWWKSPSRPIWMRPTAWSNAAERHGRILQVGHLERFNPAVVELERRATLPLFFEIHRMNIFSPRSLDVDVVLDLMIHDVDIVLALAGAEPEEIRAAGISILSEKVDIANVRLQFPNGCVANLTASRVSTERVRKLRLFQPRQYLSLDYGRQDLAIFSVGARPPDRVRTGARGQGGTAETATGCVPGRGGNAQTAEMLRPRGASNPRGGAGDS